MLDALAAGLRESSGKPFVGPKLPNLDAFFDRCARTRPELHTRLVAQGAWRAFASMSMRAFSLHVRT